MKRFLRIFLVLILLVIAALVATPFLFKDEIIAKAKSEINKQLTATVDFQDIDISLFRSFPNFNLQISALTMDGTGEFEGTRLADIGDFELELNLLSVLKGERYDIESIQLKNANFHLITTENGEVNYLITPEEDEIAGEDTASSAFELQLKEYALENINLIYEDRQGDIRAVIKHLHHSGSGNFDERIVQLHTETTIDTLDVAMEGVHYLSRVSAFANADFELDQETFTFTFKDNSLGLNDLRLAFEGTVAMPEESIDMDLSFAAQKTEFKSLLSLIPAVFMEGFEDLQTSGAFSLSGMAKGSYLGEEEKYPSFKLDLSVENGMFKYPALPASVSGVFVEMHINNPSDNLDATEIRIPKAVAKIADSPFSARMRLTTPISDPNFDVAIATDMQLKNLAAVIPANDFDYSGRVWGQLEMAGKMSDVDAERYDAVKVQGQFNASELVLKNDSLPFPIRIAKAEANFTPQTVNIPALDMQVGKSDFAASGGLDNLLNYLFEDSTLQAHFTLNSQMLDLDELYAAVPGESAATESAEEAAPLEVIRLPENIDFSLQSTFQQIRYSAIEIQNLNGAIRLKRGIAYMDNVLMNLLGGQLLLNGQYNSVEEAPLADFSFKIDGFSFKESFTNFITIQKLAPIMESAEGKYSTSMRFASALNPDMTPDLSTVAADGTLQTEGLRVAPAFMGKVANTLKSPNLSALDIGRINLNFKMENGRLNVAPFSFKAGNIPVEVEGSNGIDKSLDYTMDMKVPTGAIGATKLLEQAGVSQGGQIPVQVKLSGTISDVKVSTSFGDLAKGALDNLKQQAQAKVEEVVDDAKDKANAEAQKLIDQAEAKGDQLIANAREQAANLRAQAKTQADKIREEAKKQAEKLEAEAKGNMLKERTAKVAADKLRSEANDKAAKLEREADAKANALVEAAVREKEKLVAEARAKAQL